MPIPHPEALSDEDLLSRLAALLLLEMLADGRLHLSAIARLAPHLTEANREMVLRRAVHRSKREIGELVAELAPRPDVSASIRKLPERCGASELSSAAPRDPGGPATPSPRELRPDRVVSRDSVLSERETQAAQISQDRGPGSGSSMSTEGGAANVSGWSSTTSCPSAVVATSARPTCASCARPTTSSWPSWTTARR